MSQQGCEYFVVGSQIVLASVHPWERSVGFPFSLAVWDAASRQARPDLLLEARERGAATVDLVLEASRFASELSPDQVTEALGAFLRMIMRRGARSVRVVLDIRPEFAILDAPARQAGFVPDGGTLVQFLTPAFLTPRAQYDDMDSVYRNPLDIPWNFVPIDTDVYEPLLSDGNAGTILDLGVGFGRNAVYLERRGFDVYGVDISAAAIQRCRELVARPAQYISGDGTHLPHPTSYFDYVLDVGCLHCMSSLDRASAVAEIKRILKPRGTMYSRIFRPKSPTWLAVQPFKASEFGLTPDQAVSLFSGELQAQIWKEDPDANYVVARKE